MVKIALLVQGRPETDPSVQAFIQDFTAGGVERVEGHVSLEMFLLMVKTQGLLSLLKLHLIRSNKANY